MKTKVSRVCIYALKKTLSIIYLILKLLPIDNNKILFCSRQSSDIPLDFVLIEEELKKEAPEITCINICCHIGYKTGDYIRYGICLLKSLYHLATSRICILDSYWPAVSLLNHKNDLKVIQIWHAVGKIKQSGYQTLGKKSGRKEEYAKALNMHKNYDYVIAGAKYWNDFYCKSFGIAENQILNYGLPRLDYLTYSEQKNIKEFFAKYPELKGKKIILYAPTFRRNMKSRWEAILNEADDVRYVLIIKKHPGEHIQTTKKTNNVYYMDEFKTINLIAVCDYFITDYSAIALEAAVLKKKTYYWTYDYDEYVENNGLNIDLAREAAPYVYKDIKELMKSIRSDKYDESFIERYRKKFLPDELGTSTDKITELMKSIIKEKDVLM